MEQVMYKKLFGGVLLISVLCSAHVLAKEYPIGKPVTQSGMEIAAVYLQPVTMAPDGMMRKAEESDIHLEADLHATDNNPNGFAEGDWLPYMQVRFELVKAGSKEIIRGDLMPMVASDGPHYGDNVKLAGPGKYTLTLYVSAPDANKHQHFGRHVDKETGVAPWFTPIQATYKFVYAGVGKKGGY
jgi:uncharacterized protein involved in high-affinity Fe2+ transport